MPVVAVTPAPGTVIGGRRFVQMARMKKHGLECWLQCVYCRHFSRYYTHLFLRGKVPECRCRSRRTPKQIREDRVSQYWYKLRRKKLLCPEYAASKQAFVQRWEELCQGNAGRMERVDKSLPFSPSNMRWVEDEVARLEQEYGRSLPPLPVPDSRRLEFVEAEARKLGRTVFEVLDGYWEQTESGG